MIGFKAELLTLLREYNPRWGGGRLMGLDALPRSCYQSPFSRDGRQVSKAARTEPDGWPADGIVAPLRGLSTVRGITVRLHRGVGFQLAVVGGAASWKLTPLIPRTVPTSPSRLRFGL
jgi:hypothetical protein